MKLLVLSDLHVEFAAYQPDPAVMAASDAVVLACDIHIGATAIEWSRRPFLDKPIVLVAGNYELYGGHWVHTLFQQAGLWIHAPTHNSCRYEVNGCKVVCNPRDYLMGRLSSQFENDTFDPGLLLEQSPTGLWQVSEI